MSYGDEVLTEAIRSFEAKDLARSEKLFDQLVRTGTHLADASYGLGMVALASGREAAAIERFHACVAFEPGHANAHFQLGRIAEARKDLALAEAHYRHAVASRPDHAGARARLKELGIDLERGSAARISDDRGWPMPQPIKQARTQRASAATSDVKTPPPPREPTRDVPRPPRPPSSWTRSLVGIVNDLTYRTEAAGRSMNARTIYNFRLRLFDEQGNERETIGVELRGLGFSGGLKDGDWVELDRSQQRRPGEALTTHSLRNLSTGGDVKGKRFRL